MFFFHSSRQSSFCLYIFYFFFLFFFQAEDGIRDHCVTGVQTCALPILRFDVSMLARRLVAAVDWLSHAADTTHLPLGCFGASTGAASALIAAVERPEVVTAVVSRGGRPDLAGPSLALVHVPTLLLVGGNDAPVIELNRRAMAQMRAEVRLEIVPGPTHVSEEPGTLDVVAGPAAAW